MFKYIVTPHKVNLNARKSTRWLEIGPGQRRIPGFESAPLFLTEDFGSSSTMGEREDKKIVVPAVNLNRLVEELRPTYLILDVEGAEVEMAPALRLDGVEKLLVEVHAHVTGNDKANEMVQTLVQAGFLVDYFLSRRNQVYMTR